MDDKESLEVQKEIKSLVAWRNVIMGGLMVCIFFAGLCAWLLRRNVDKLDNLTLSIAELAQQVAVFKTEVKPFITYGDRFSKNDWDKERRFLISELRQERNQEFKAKGLPDILIKLEQGDKDHANHGREIQSLIQRVTALERHQHNQ